MASGSGSRPISITEFVVGNLDISIPILPEQVGQLIGKGAENIKAIEAATGSKIFITSYADEVRTPNVRITGTKPQVKAAEKLLNKHLRRSTFRLSISPLEVFKVIGRSSVIKGTIQAKTGAKIGVDKEQLAVIISGNTSQIRETLKMISDLLGRPCVHPNFAEPLETYSDVRNTKQPIYTAELTANRQKLKLVNLDLNTKESDILKLCSDSKVIPKLMLRGGEATFMFASPTEAMVWARKIDGSILLSRMIVLKKSKSAQHSKEQELNN